MSDKSSSSSSGGIGFRPKREFIVAPIALFGAVYSVTIGYVVHHHHWNVAATLFCYGIALLGARIAQLIARR